MLIFLEAAEASLVRRFSETRRPHPLAPDRSAVEGIREERKAMRPIRRLADQVVDTSGLTVHDLRHTFTGVASGRAPGSPLVVTILSFGFRHGVPADSDSAVRRPLSAEPALRAGAAGVHRTRREGRPLSRSRQDRTQEFLAHSLNLLRFLVPQYLAEGKTYLTIGIGVHRRPASIGGDCRSAAERPGRLPGVQIRVKHRDIAVD